jgi:hypothetical protein
LRGQCTNKTGLTVLIDLSNYIISKNNFPGFSIQGWLGETYENKETLDPYVVNELMRDLKLEDCQKSLPNNVGSVFRQ